MITKINQNIIHNANSFREDLFSSMQFMQNVEESKLFYHQDQTKIPCLYKGKQNITYLWPFECIQGYDPKSKLCCECNMVRNKDSLYDSSDDSIDLTQSTEAYAMIIFETKHTGFESDVIFRGQIFIEQPTPDILNTETIVCCKKLIGNWSVLIDI